MPVFHFNLDDHVRYPDVEGTELGSIEEARAEAITFAGAYLRDNPDLIRHGEPFRVEVTDDADTALFEIRIEMIEA